MDTSEPTHKPVNQLTLSDFANQPIWSFADDDGDEVVPVIVSEHLPWPPGGEVLFVACEFVLSDKTKMLGYVGVRMTDHSIYLLGFPEDDGSFFLWPVKSALEGSVSKDELFSHVHKAANAIFPVTYVSPYGFEDGQTLAGRYTLPE